jgi:hypothetical protein
MRLAWDTTRVLQILSGTEGRMDRLLMADLPATGMKGFLVCRHPYRSEGQEDQTDNTC